MTTPGWYLAGLLAAGLAGAAMAALAPTSIRTEIAAGVLSALMIQAPLGWWTVRSIGTERFQLVWLGGMLLRVMAVTLGALVLAPVFRWERSAFLLSLVASLLALLLVEAAAALREHSASKG